MQATKPWIVEASPFKLYVCPVTKFDEDSLKELFSKYVEVKDVFISPPRENGYKWAFVYLATEEDLLEAISKFKDNFKIKRANPKPFQLGGAAVSPGPFLGAKMMNGIVKNNGVSYVAPPNCVHCRKLTFLQCISCKNPFCSKECTLDGWRSHTSSCVKIAELANVSELNGVQDNALTSTVVNFMKDCKTSNKKFTSDEFADACNFRGLVTVSPSMPKEEPTPDEYDNATSPNKRDKGGKSVAALQKSPQTISDAEEDPWAASIEKKSMKTPLKNNTKCNVTPPCKQTRKFVTGNGDVERNTKEKPFSDSQPKKYPHNSDGEETVVPNGYRSDERHVDFKKKTPNEFKRPVKSKETRCNRRMSLPETDLKLKPGDAVPVIVASIENANTFFVANSESVLKVLTEIHDFAEVSPGLKTVEINELCLAFFDGDWYRARILATNPIKVEYIDYGNREFCEIEDLKVLPKSLQKYLPLATKVQLKDGDVSRLKIKENEEIEIYVDKFDSQSNTWIIDVL